MHWWQPSRLNYLSSGRRDAKRTLYRHIRVYNIYYTYIISMCVPSHMKQLFVVCENVCSDIYYNNDGWMGFCMRMYMMGAWSMGYQNICKRECIYIYINIDPLGIICFNSVHEFIWLGHIWNVCAWTDIMIWEALHSVRVCLWWCTLLNYV